MVDAGVVTLPDRDRSEGLGTVEMPADRGRVCSGYVTTAKAHG